MSEETQFIFDELRKDYPLFISREQYAEVIGVSVSTVQNRMTAGFGLPNYRRAGDWVNAKVIFNLKDVAEFLAADQIKTA